MEAIHTPKMSVNFCELTPRNIRTDSHLQTEKDLTLVRPNTYRLNGNIKTDLKRNEYECINRFHPAQNTNQFWAPMNTIMSHRIPYKERDLSSFVTVSLTASSLLHGANY